MSPSLAVLLWLVLLLGLLCFDPSRDPRVSIASWVPVIWLFIVGSRLPSQWLGVQVGQMAAAMEDGNPTDRAVYSALILAATAVLIARSWRWGEFFAHNVALTLFLSFALLSFIWSDSPDITFKRWLRDLGNYLVILVVLSDPHPLEATRTVLRRLGFLLIPLSVVLVKYYPYVGRQYNAWTGAADYTGATLSKNMLGVLCLISGIFFFWDIIARWRNRKEARTRRIILVNLSFIAMTLWLLNMSNSATSRLCLALGSLVILAAHSKTAKRHPLFLKVTIPTGICVYLLLAFAFGIDINTLIAGAVGRDPTLTGRTVIWNAVLSMHTNPLLGAGYESFWLGPRLLKVWALTGAGINEAHNGYLELYLNLGLIGLCLLGGFLISSFRTVCRRLDASSNLGSLSLALWAILPFYNVSEAAFKGQLMFVIFLLVAISAPQAQSEQASLRRERSEFERLPHELQEPVSI